jgi:hypothetical protein
MHLSFSRAVHDPASYPSPAARRFNMRAFALALAAVFGLASHGRAFGQGPGSPAQPAPGRNRIVVFVEPLAAGAQYTRGIGGGWSTGAAVVAGPLRAVTIAQGGSGQFREWLGAYALLRYGPDQGIQAAVSPVGAALIVGDDFAAVYPSAQAGLEFARGRLNAGSWVRLIRIAGGGGSGLYRVRWSPVQLGYAFSW